MGLIKRTFPNDAERALAIAKCESGYNPNAYNSKNPDGSNDGGLWQLNSVHDRRLKELGLNKYDPEDATAFARMLYDESGGFSDWVCHSKGLAYR